MQNLSVLVGFAILTLAVRVSAIPMSSHTWFMGGNTLVQEMLDPIVNPNKQSSHQHMIFGGSAFGASYDYQEYASASCSSVQVGVDKSNYWIPQLYWVEGGVNNPKGFTPLDGSIRIYYNNVRDAPDRPTTAFPKGLRMLVGNPNLRTEPNRNKKLHVCQVNKDFSGNQQDHSFNFNRTCPEGLKSQIDYPSCWNGKILYTSDGSHMAYPTSGQPCPLSHPIRVPEIRFEITWYPNNWAPGAVMKDNLVWANGDATGYGMHSDFVNGWEIDKLQAALADPRCSADTLPNPTRFGSCPIFTPSYVETPNCSPMKGSLKDPYGSVNFVTRPELPGCNKIWIGTGAKPTCSPAVPLLDVSSFTGTDGSLTPAPEDTWNATLPTADGWHQVGCTTIDKPLANQYRYDGMTTLEECQTSCLKGNRTWAAMSPVGTNGAFGCLCGTSRLSTSPMGDACDTPCPGDSSQTCGGSERWSIFYAPSSTLARVAGMERRGCYAEPYTVSAGLRGKMEWSFQDNNKNTGALCMAACREHDSGYTWAATRDRQNCYCGTTFALGTGYWRPDSSCTSTCPGNSSETCGGSGQLNVYDLTVNPIGNASSSTKLAGWKGCFSEVSSGNALLGTSWTDFALTPQRCADGCAELGYKFAGVEQGNLCMCGDTVPATNLLPSSSCSRPCGGAANQTCGATRIYELYEVASTTKITESQIATKYPVGWQGCYYTPSKTDGFGSTYTFSSYSLTLDSCASGCHNMGYRYAGPRNGMDCTCSNTAITSKQVLSSYCNMGCRGNTTQTCGASFYTEVYDLEAMNVGSSDTGDAEGYISCRSDPNMNAAGNAVYAFKSALMTVPLCAQACKEIGQPRAAVEAGNLCFCGGSWPTTTYQVLPDNQCVVPCVGNSSMTCGGSKSAAVYDSAIGADIPAKPPAWQGCFPDATSNRLLPGGSASSSSAMTSTQCRQTCLLRGFKYASVYRGNQCMCGDTLSNASKIPSAQCNYACVGNSTETCGGDNFADLYLVDGIGGTADGDLGCISDISTLNVNLYASSYMNGAVCRSACGKAGYAFAGTQPGKCRCGNTSPKSIANAGTCNVACTGSTTGEMCGSSVSSNAYAVKSADPAFGEPRTMGGVNGFLGCYGAGTGQVLLNNGTSFTNDNGMSVEMCLSNCAQMGMKYGGLLQGRRCYCSASINIDNTGAYRVAETSCNTACTGNSNQICGATSAFSVYDLAASGVASASMPEGYKGCFAAGNVFTSPPYTYKTTMTQSLCRRTCRNKGFAFAAVTLTNMCACAASETWGTPRALQLCDAKCSGDASTTCGYSSIAAASILDATGPGSLPPSGFPSGYVGCYSGDISAITKFSIASSTMTSASCGSICRSKGLTSAYALTSSNSCRCLSSLPVIQQLDQLCSYSCSGAAGEKCGANGYYSVYQDNFNGASSGSVTNLSSSAISSTAISSTRATVASSSIVSSSLASASVNPSSVASTVRASTTIASTVRASTTIASTVRTSTTVASTVRTSTSTSIASSSRASSFAASSLTSRASSVASGTTRLSTAATATATLRTNNAIVEGSEPGCSVEPSIVYVTLPPVTVTKTMARRFAMATAKPRTIQFFGKHREGKTRRMRMRDIAYPTNQ